MYTTEAINKRRMIEDCQMQKKHCKEKKQNGFKRLIIQDQVFEGMFCDDLPCGPLIHINPTNGFIYKLVQKNTRIMIDFCIERNIKGNLNEDEIAEIKEAFSLDN